MHTRDVHFRLFRVKRRRARDRSTAPDSVLVSMARDNGASGSGGGNGGNDPPNFDSKNGEDTADIHTKTTLVKFDFCPVNIKFFFSQLEMLMETTGVQSQWQKRLLLKRNLPQDVISELEDLLVKNRAEAGVTAYKDLKDRLFEAYGPTPEEAYHTARALVMTGKPSQHAKKLINILCPKHPTLMNCCMEGTISTLWRDQLPYQVRAQVAHHTLGGESKGNAKTSGFGPLQPISACQTSSGRYRN